MSVDVVCSFRLHHRTKWWPLSLMPHSGIVQFPRSNTILGLVVCAFLPFSTLPFNMLLHCSIDMAKRKEKQIENRNSHPNICRTRRCTGGWYNVCCSTRSTMATARRYCNAFSSSKHETSRHSKIIYDDVQIRWVMEMLAANWSTLVSIPFRFVWIRFSTLETDKRLLC